MKKKVILKITAEEIDDEHIINELSLNCANSNELLSACESLANAMEENQSFRQAFNMAILPRLLKNIAGIEEAENISSMNLPNFDEIVKNAKIDPNKNIKEN